MDETSIYKTVNHIESIIRGMEPLDTVDDDLLQEIKHMGISSVQKYSNLCPVRDILSSLTASKTPKEVRSRLVALSQTISLLRKVPLKECQ